MLDEAKVLKEEAGEATSCLRALADRCGKCMSCWRAGPVLDLDRVASQRCEYHGLLTVGAAAKLALYGVLSFSFLRLSFPIFLFRLPEGRVHDWGEWQVADCGGYRLRLCINLEALALAGRSASISGISIRGWTPGGAGGGKMTSCEVVLSRGALACEGGGDGTGAWQRGRTWSHNRISRCREHVGGAPAVASLYRLVMCRVRQELDAVGRLYAVYQIRTRC